MTSPADQEAPGTVSCALGTEGGQNLRDLGGYRTRDGREVRWRMIFRSGTLHHLTERDHAFLQTLGIRTVCDFRNARERTRDAVVWPAAGAPRIFSDEQGRDISLLASASAPNATAEDAQRIMAGLYDELLDDLNPQYRRLFQELLAGHAPLIFNCAAGKDRTGIAAALVLAALNVPRETIVRDYLLTNRHFDMARMAQAPQPRRDDWSNVPPGILNAYRMADEAYLRVIFARLDDHPGGEALYFQQRLGVTPDGMRELRGLYTR